MLGSQVLHKLWNPPNSMRDIEQLAGYFSVPPVVIHRELQELDLLPEEYAGEKITVEWMVKDARLQRERRREGRERFLKDNEGRDVESMFGFEEWSITSSRSSAIPLQDFVIDPAIDYAAKPVPDNYLAAEDEDRAKEIEQAIDAGEQEAIATSPNPIIRRRAKK